MNRKIFSLGVVGLLLVAGANTVVAEDASGALSTPVPVWQGAAYITAANAACATGNIGVGSNYVSLYRSQVVSPTSDGGGMSFLYGRGGVTVNLPTGVPLPGGPQTATVNAVGISGSTGLYNYSTTFNVNISPPAPSASTVQVFISGTMTNMLGYAGCTITFRASMVLRT